MEDGAGIAHDPAGLRSREDHGIEPLFGTALLRLPILAAIFRVQDDSCGPDCPSPLGSGKSQTVEALVPAGWLRLPSAATVLGVDDRAVATTCPADLRRNKEDCLQGFSTARLALPRLAAVFRMVDALRSSQIAVWQRTGSGNPTQET